MKYSLLLFSLVLFGCPKSSATEFMPPMPGMTSGSMQNGMKHAEVSQAGSTLSVHVAEPPLDIAPPSPVVMRSGYGADFMHSPQAGDSFPDPNKFDVLEDVFFNAQYGWLPQGFFNLPAGSFLWIERTNAVQPAGSNFQVYEAGNGAEGMGAWSMNAIYTHDGFRWQWDGAMQHDYYTADLPGQYSMSFSVYVGDSMGEPLGSFTPANATLEFQVVPEPSSLLLGVLGSTVCCIRRR